MRVCKKIRNEKGFTLLEMLLTFSIFLLIVSFIPMMINVVFIDSKTEKSFNELEWEVFIQQAKIEIREATEITATNDTLFFNMSNGDIISYEKYQDVIRRRVNNRGHEVLLQNIVKVEYTPVSNGILIETVDRNGNKYKRRISSISPIQVSSQ